MAGILYWTVPLQYEAEVLILVHSVKPSLFPENAIPTVDYDLFINSQLGLIHTPIVIDKALENFGAADLPSPHRQEWLTKRIKAQRVESSDIMSVSFKSENPETAEKIVNAVLDSYLLYANSTEWDNDRELLSDLQNEKNKITSILQNLYRTIQVKEKQKEKGDTLQEEAALDILLEKDQFERIKKLLNLIEDRIFTLRIEQDAPSRVMPLSRATLSPPLRREKIMIAGIGAVISASVPLFLNFTFACFCRKKRVCPTKTDTSAMVDTL